MTSSCDGSDGRLGVIAPPERGSITAMHPMAVLRGTAPDRDRIEALIERCTRAGGTSLTLASDAPAPTTIVFGTDGWRARIADEFTFENVRRCADGVARYVTDRGETAKGVVVAYDRRFASEHFARPRPRSCSPTTSRSPSPSMRCRPR